MIPSSDVADHPAHILIVDDESINRKLMAIMLTPEGFVLHSAASGEEALVMVAQQPPDLILLDTLMPRMDGYQVVAAIKGDLATRHIPVLMVTGLDDRDAMMRGLSAGAEDFLTKPVDRAELCVRVRNLLRLKAYGDHYRTYSEMLEGETISCRVDLVERTEALAQQSTALRRSEARASYALGAARLGVWELDVVTERLTWSESMAPLFGLTAAQAPTSAGAFFALIHPDDRRIVEDSLTAQAVREGADYREGANDEVEFRVLWPDGSTHWIAGRARLLRDADQKPGRLIGVATDITERKSLEAQLGRAQKN